MASLILRGRLIQVIKLYISWNDILRNAIIRNMIPMYSLYYVWLLFSFPRNILFKLFNLKIKTIKIK